MLMLMFIESIKPVKHGKGRFQKKKKKNDVFVHHLDFTPPPRPMMFFFFFFFYLFSGRFSTFGRYLEKNDFSP